MRSSARAPRSVDIRFHDELARRQRDGEALPVAVRQRSRPPATGGRAPRNKRGDATAALLRHRGRLRGAATVCASESRVVQIPACQSDPRHNYRLAVLSRGAACNASVDEAIAVISVTVIYVMVTDVKYLSNILFYAPSGVARRDRQVKAMQFDPM